MTNIFEIAHEKNGFIFQLNVKKLSSDDILLILPFRSLFRSKIIPLIAASTLYKYIIISKSWNLWAGKSKNIAEGT